MLLRRPYRIRAASPGRPSMEVTVPMDSDFHIGQRVVVMSNGFLLVVPHGVQVNEAALEVLLDKEVADGKQP